MQKLTWLQDRRNLLFFALAFLMGGALALAGLTLTSASQNGDVVASVNGQPITREQFFSRLEEIAGDQVLEQMITELVIAQAEGTHGVAISEEEIVAELDAVKESFGSEEAFQTELARYNLTEERLLYEIRLNLILTKLSQKDVVVSDEEVEQFFEENKDLLDLPEQIRVSHILVETEDEAEEILAQLEEGADFAELARAKSIDTASGVQGGEIGFIHRESPVVEEFKSAAFALDVGELSQPVESQFGWHIIRVEERIEAVTATLENSRERIVNYLTEQKAKPIGQVLSELRSAAKVEVEWPRYAAFDTGRDLEQRNGAAGE